jgi:SAM-dependent methyltransferase
MASAFREVDAADHQVQLDERSRRLALESLRRSNAKVILENLSRLRPLAGSRLCDIGCAYGWFLEAAGEHGMSAVGIEPDLGPADDARGRGLDVRVGCFPQCLDPRERFDVITLNDVLEHLDHVEQILQACREHLHSNGLLVIALPSSEGALYGIACHLRRLGIRGPFDRLWQKPFPCPHVHYFSSANLVALLRRSGFEIQYQESLPPYRIGGLWSRLRMNRGSTYPLNVLTWLLLWAAAPLLVRLPSDTVFHVYRKP